jgi:predicted aspartyl protease
VNVRHLKVRYGGRTNVLPMKVEIGSAFQVPEPPPPKMELFDAIWDTGASCSVITQKVVDALGLKPIGITRSRHAQGETDTEVFLISLRFPQSIGFPTLRVTRGILGDHLQVLIGMDVISRGDLSITNHDGATELNFQVPSQGLGSLHTAQQKLHFPAQPNLPPDTPSQPTATSPVEPAHSNKIPRNAPCPCGSGKKYKKCCGANNPPVPGA